MQNAGIEKACIPEPGVGNWWRRCASRKYDTEPVMRGALRRWCAVCAVLSGLSGSALSLAEVYLSVGADGEASFSDEGSAGAVAIDVAAPPPSSSAGDDSNWRDMLEVAGVLEKARLEREALRVERLRARAQTQTAESEDLGEDYDADNRRYVSRYPRHEHHVGRQHGRVVGRGGHPRRGNPDQGQRPHDNEQGELKIRYQYPGKRNAQ